MLTGEPDAGNLHVRFGGRGGANQCAIPTPYQGGRRPRSKAAAPPGCCSEAGQKSPDKAWEAENY